MWGGENAWNFYFKQPFDFSVENSKDTIPVDYFLTSESDKIINGIMSCDHREIMKWNQVYQKYVHLQDGLERKVAFEWNRIKGIVQDKKILGVKFRGTDYRSDKIPGGHFYQTDVYEMVDYAKKYMQDVYDYIYLAVEEQETLEIFKQEFGNKLLYYDCKLISNYESGAVANVAADIVGKKKSGEDYIIVVELLARCDALLSSANSGSIMSVIINGGKYKDIYWINKGTSK